MAQGVLQELGGGGVSDTRSGPGKQKISCKEQLYSEWKKLKGRPIPQR
jgi:hypothetical protein